MNKIAILLALLGVTAFAQQKGSFVDPRDKKTYKTVKIGKQTWMAENLNYDASGSKCYGEGSKVFDFGEEDYTITLSATAIKANCEKFGRLYNVEIVEEVCPTGWYLPTGDDWDNLIKFVGGEKKAAEKLRAKNGWAKNFKSGTDEYGFNALPGGYGSSYGFIYADYYGSWWGAWDKPNRSRVGMGIDYAGGNEYLAKLKEKLEGEDLKGLHSVRCYKE